MNRTLNAILLSAGLCSLPNLSFSAIVYDNTANNLNQQYFPTDPTLEFGDQITLFGTDRTLSQISFYYFLSGSSLTSQSMTLRLYAGNGSNPPTTPFYTSDPIDSSRGLALGGNTETISFDLATPVTLPDNLIWTVQFSNLAAGQTGGLLLYGPPTVGSSLNDFWQKDSTGTWSLMQVNGGATLADFATRVTAVPEPSVLALGGIGAVLLVGLRGFRKTPR